MGKRTRFWGLMAALAVCLCLCACARTESAERQPASPKKTYVSDFVPLVKADPDYITVRGFEDGMIYYSKSEKVGDNTPEGVLPDYAGQFDIYEAFLYRTDRTGSSSKLEGYKSVDSPVNDAGLRSFSSGSDLLGICFTDDGFLTVEMTYTFWSEGSGAEEDEETEDQSFSQQYYIRSFDREGNERSRAPLSMADGDWLDFEAMQPDGRGNVLIPSLSSIRAVSADGRDAYVIDTDAEVEGLIRLSDGRCAVMVKKNGRMLCPIDTEAEKLLEGVPVSFSAENAVTGGGGYSVCYTDGDYFYGYSFGSEEPDRLFGWTALDVNADILTVLDVSEDGTVTGVTTRYDDRTDTTDLDLVTVSLVSGSAAAQKQVLHLGALYTDYNLQNIIIDFNRRSDQYRIELVDYSVYGRNQDGTSGGETMLNTEIVSGTGPDILCLSGLNYQRLAAGGLLEDLYPYIDADPDLKREDFFPNVLSALEADGKLCAAPSGFYLYTVIGASSVVGEGPGWTYEEFARALSSMPEGCTAFDMSTTRDDVLSACLALDMGDFVDWENGTVRFDSPDFIELLEFAASFPSELDWADPELDQDAEIGDRLAQGKQMLVETGAYSLEDLFYSDYSQYLGGSVTFIGYPAGHGSGSMLSFEEEPLYAISSASANKDAAWQFLRSFLTAAYQRRLLCVPSRIDVFEEKAAEASTIQYQKNSDGKYELDAHGEKIPVVRYVLWDSEAGRPRDIYTVSPEQVEKVRRLISTTSRIADYNADILSIVEEQAAPFFAGQKSAAEAARLIQSKANIYVNEQR